MFCESGIKYLNMKPEAFSPSSRDINVSNFRAQEKLLKFLKRLKSYGDELKMFKQRLKLDENFSDILTATTKRFFRDYYHKVCSAKYPFE